MNQRIVLIVLVTLLAAGAALLLLVPDTTVKDGVVFTGDADLSEANAPSVLEEQSDTPGIPDVIAVGTPTTGQVITSPLTVTGSARGSWYADTVFPIEVRNAAGVVIATSSARAQSEWSADEFVIFHTTVVFPKQAPGSQGQVVLQQANPVGDAARNQQVVIPIRFK